MAEDERATLRRQKEAVAREVVAAGLAMDVVYELREAGVIQPAVADSLMRSESTKTNMVRQLVGHLETCGRGALAGLAKVLLRLGLTDLVKRLDARLYNQHRDAISGKSDKFDNLQRAPQSPLSAPPGAEALPFLRRPNPGPQRSRPGSFGYDSGDENMSPDEPLRVFVRPSEAVGGGHLDESELYKNLSSPRGLVFMANYKDFYNEEYPTRVGSEIDVKNLTILLSQMGYKIPKQHINMTKYETIKALREFKSREELAKVDSCIVIVMSHGRDEKSFYTSDNQYLSVNDVVERFSNRECPALKGKPKIFIFQYCRGPAPDVGVMPTPQPVNYVKGQRGVQTDAAYQSEAVVERDPTYTDMYIAYSTVEGFVSFRHPERGSWLMEAICYVFMNHAHNLELEALMKMVSRRVRKNYTDDGSKQVCEFVQRAFDRHFYFNPKLPDNIGSMCLSPLSRALSESTQSLEGRLSPVLYRNPHLASHHRAPTPEPLYLTPLEHQRIRQRHWSGASNGSDQSADEFDPNWNGGGAMLHPRIRRISGTRRYSGPCHLSSLMVGRGEAWGRSFSEQPQGSRGTTPDPFDAPDVLITHASEAAVTPRSPLPFDDYDIVDCKDVTNNNRGVSSLAGPGGDAASGASSGATSGASSPGEEPTHAMDDDARRIKRQLSIPSTNETLAKINDVKKFLQVHDSDPDLLKPLQRIESFVNKKKGKRRKMETESSSLEY